MLNTKQILIPCSKSDVWLARIAVASVRYYYPEIPIFLIKDLSNGDFSTTEIEDAFNVKIYRTVRKFFGWGFSKIEPFLIGETQLTFVMDADAVMTGYCLEQLENEKADVVVSGYQETRPDQLKRSYFDLGNLAIHDPEFTHTGQVFNSGQMLIDFSKFDKTDFKKTGIEEADEKLKSTLIHIYGKSDQGILNYVFLKKSQLKEINLSDAGFMLWPHGKNTPNVSVEDLKDGNSQPKVMHWAGPKDPIPHLLKQSHILLFFEDIYYRRIKFGTLKRTVRMLRRTPIRVILSAIYKRVFV